MAIITIDGTELSELNDDFATDLYRLIARIARDGKTRSVTFRMGGDNPGTWSFLVGEHTRAHLHVAGEPVVTDDQGDLSAMFAEFGIERQSGMSYGA